MGGKTGLKHGYTTGATAAAAAKAATLLLLNGKADEVSLTLPWNSPNAVDVAFKAVYLFKEGSSATAGVLKDGGDDPDATHGMEIRATVSLSEGDGPIVSIDGGEGVGRVTKPGLAARVGEAAINPVPRMMIEAAVLEAFSEAGAAPGRVSVVISAPEGEQRGKKTMNARLGVVGGISILGTNGIVVPMSTAAWTATIDACLDVAKAAGQTRALLAFGRTSESAGQALFPELKDNAAVLMGDHVGYALDAARQRGMDVVIVGQFAKLCKLANRSYETHVSDSTLDLGLLRRLMLEAGFGTGEADEVLQANTAREVFESLLSKGDRGLFPLLCKVVTGAAQERLGGATSVQTVLVGYDKALLASFGPMGGGKDG